MSLDFLLEIGTEEIPHWMFPAALEQLVRLLTPDLLGATPRVDATPRRLVVRAFGVPEHKMAGETLIQGPPRSAGSVAVEKFASKMGASANGLELRATPKGEYYFFLKKDEGYGAGWLLERHLPGHILSIQWPKTMRWTKAKNVDFIRPIRWIVALLGDEVIPFEIAGVKSGNVTRGHRLLGSSSIPVTIANYESELRRNFVILSSHERRHKIEKEASALGAKIDADLLETLTFITEYPAAIRGEFDPKFLELPAEVLTTVMRHHQKYFSVESAAGALAPNFVAVMNTSGDPDGLVKHGNERVLKARFNDARFFWDVDQSKTLEDRVADLAHVTFQAKLGSYLGKTDRMVDLVKELGGNQYAQRAAKLSKCDLTTEMVKEFTDLQGIVGGLYARAQGEPEPVWRAIYEHYKPLSMDDEIPATHEGQIVALADKLDTLRECFRIGMVPTGSRDPFALRRAAQGVVKILAEAKIQFAVQKWASGELLAFFEDRIKYYFRDVRGYKYDEVTAVLASGACTLADVEERLSALGRVRTSENFEPLAASFKRIRNILKQAAIEPEERIDVTLLEAGPERDLYQDYERVRSATRGATYGEALEAIASLRPSVDLFFDKVLVNAGDPKVRANRLTLLHYLLTEFSTIADFSEIVTSGDQK
jgi:glycyl-tRNA synthetase beta chain